MTPTEKQNLLDLIEAAQVKALRLTLRGGDRMLGDELAEQLLADIESVFAELKEYARE
jgi:hypothetical protein